MLLRELFFNRKQLLSEGGNLEINGHQAHHIDLKVHNRSVMIPLLNSLLHAINSGFKGLYKSDLWNPKTLASQEFLSGSSLHFFNTKGISDETFVQKKPKVGDIDTMVSLTHRDSLEAWLKSVHQRQVGPARFLGYKLGNEQFSSLWEFQNPPIKIQIDFEFVDFNQDRPTEWARFSHSSSWNDLSAGVKGVFHKFLIQSLAGLTNREFLLRKMTGRGKAKVEQDIPTTDNMVSFAVSSKEGGGLRAKYEPVLDDNGKPVFKDGLQVMRALPAAGYNKDVTNIMHTIFGSRIHQDKVAELAPKFWSFVGILDIMNEVLAPDEKKRITNVFIQKLFAPGAQGLYKGDANRDIEEKNVALNLLLTKLKVSKPAGLDQLIDTYRQAYKTTSINEAEEPAVVQSKRKGIVHLEKMKDLDFLNLLDELKDDATGKFTLNNIPMNVKVDGFGGRLGMDSAGRPYAETSRSGPKFEPGQFTAYAKAKGVDAEALAVSAKWDQWWDQMVEVTKAVAKHIDLKDTKIHVEVLYLPFAEEQEDGRLKFVGIHYNKFPEDVNMALVPLFAEVSSTGAPHPNNDQIISAMKALKQVGSTMIIDNSLTTKNTIDATALIPPMENIEALRAMLHSNKRDQKREAAEALQPLKDELAKFIINHPDVVGKDILGKDYEGIILNTKQGHVKITSPEQKQVIANKNAAIAAAGQARKAAGSANRTKTAVVTAGSFVGHKGHEQLVNLVLNKAKEVGGDPYVYISPSMGPDDPIPPNVKLETWKKLYPQHADMFQIWQEGGTPVKKIEKELVLPPDSPYKHIILMVGTDRFVGMKKWMDTLSKRMKDPRYPGSHNHVTFDTIETKREAEHGGTGISFTQCREALLDNTKTPEQQLTVWLKAFDEKKLGREWIAHLMEICRKNMGLAKAHTSPSGVKTNMSPKDDDYAINYGPHGLAKPHTAHKGHSPIKEANSFIRLMKRRIL